MGLYRRDRTWWLSYIDGAGRRRRESSHSDRKGVAQGLLDRRRAAAQLGESPARDSRVTMGVLIDRYEAAVKHQASYKPVRQSLLKRVRTRFGLMSVARLSTYELQRWQSELLESGKVPEMKRVLLEKGTPEDIAKAAEIDDVPMAPASVNKLVGQVKAILARAVEWGMATPAQLAAVRRVKQLEEDKRLRYLSLEEAKALLAACEPQLRCIVGLLLFTGCRPGEILALRWDQVDMDQALLLLPKTKTGRREIHLSAMALAFLGEAERLRDEAEEPSTSPYVFPGRFGERPMARLQKGFRNACDEAKVKGVRPYDLRHTFASWMVQDGEGLRTVQELLGHSKAQTTMRYAHLGREDLQSAVERLATRRSVA